MKKKLFVLLMVIVMVFSLAGCGSSQADSQASADVSEDTDASFGTGSTQTYSNCGGTGVVTQTEQYYDAVLGWQTNTYTTACPTCDGTGVITY